MIRVHAISFCLLLFLSATAVRPAEVTLFAAASLSDPLKVLAPEFSRATGDKLVFNFGASSLLARQIQEGAPADVFFSADEEKMNGLERRGLVLRETRRSLLSNVLVVTVRAEDGARLSSVRDLAGGHVKRIALAETKTVPAGIYARKYLESAGLWEAVKQKVVPTENVRGALAALEAGNVDAAIVYKTDALISREVKVACEVPPAESPEISYAIAVIKDARDTATAKRLVHFLASPAALKVFEKYGFVVGRNG